MEEIDCKEITAFAQDMPNMLNSSEDQTLKLKKVVAMAEQMFQSNLQCLAHILALKKENAELKTANTEFKEEAEAVELQLARDASDQQLVLVTRIASLEKENTAQKAELDELRTVSALRGAWVGLLSPEDLAMPYLTSKGQPILLRRYVRADDIAV
jgi:hypothetical protein